MAGLIPSQNLRQPAPEPESFDGEDQVINLSDDDPPASDVVIKFPDGSVEISLNGSPKPKRSLEDSKFDDNLAEALDDSSLGALAEDLLMGIEEDERSREDWLQDRAEGLKLLALKVEKSSTGTGDSAAGIDNTSRSRHPMILEAVLRFQANAQGELLPTDGPVKVESELGADQSAEDDLAQTLEDDLNYYLKHVATEYYPDTERMFFLVGAGGCGFKKVYRCPIRRRPVSESITAENIIISNAATDILNADRVTFITPMIQSRMKRMQKIGAYRDIHLGQPSQDPKNAVEEQVEEITGVGAATRPEDMSYAVFECYCMIDLEGDEHTEKGEITGLPRPYKVTIEKGSRQILEIRRNWKKDDPLEQRRKLFVKYSYVPAFGFYDVGIIQIAGNSATAATALMRIMIDAGIFGNFPGGLVAKSADKQNTTDIAVNPGGFAPIDTSMIPDGDIRKAVMNLPYKEPGQAIMALFTAIVQTGAKLAGTADLAVGEGRQDAPVGTTIALIEQATKVTDAVHKRMHAAQAEEFSLLRDLFREYPEDFINFNRRRDNNWNEQKLLAALDDYNLVPRADPNTSSHMQRIMRWQALYQLAAAHPDQFQIVKVLEAVLRILGINDPKNYLAPPPAPGSTPPPDPKAQAALISAQADQTNAQAKLADVTLRQKNLSVENQNRDQDRQADLQIAATKLKTEEVIHARDQQFDAASQMSQQQHEKDMQHGDHMSDHAQMVTGLVSDHAKQAADHANAQTVAAAKPAPVEPKPKGEK